MKNKHLYTKFLVVLLPLIVLLVTIPSSCKKDQKEDVVFAPVYTDGHGVIDSRGGTVMLKDPSSSINGAFVQIPAGALDQSVEIKIVAPSPSVKFIADSTCILVKFEPENLKFKQPVIIGIPYLNHSDTTKLRIYYYNPDSSIIFQIPKTKIDIQDKIVIGQTNHFSYYTVWDDRGSMDIEMLNIDNNKIGVRLKINDLKQICTTFGTAHYWNIYNAWDAINNIEYPVANSIFTVKLYKDGYFWNTCEKTLILYIHKQSDEASHYSYRAEVIHFNENFSRFNTNYYPFYQDDMKDWFSGKPLIFNFTGFTPNQNAKYFVQVEYCLSKDIFGSDLITPTFTFSNVDNPEKRSEMTDYSSTNIYDNYIDDSYVNNYGHKPLVNTYDAENITCNGARLEGELMDQGDSPITEYGFCWSQSSPPSIVDQHCNYYDPNGLISYSYDCHGLLRSNTIYYIMAYARNEFGISYGKEIVVITKQDTEAPVLTDKSPSSGETISGTYLLVAEVTDDCKVDYVEFEVYEGAFIFIGSDDEPSSGNLYSVEFNTTTVSNGPHQLKVVMHDKVGRISQFSWGIMVSNVPGQLPSVTTDIISSYTSNSAVGGGIVTSEGASSVTARGVCWSNSDYPTINDNHTTDGTGTGSFTSNLTGLTANTPYYLKAYATNSMGTSYGNQVTFTTNGGGSGCQGITSVNYQGQTYNTIEIGDQCWLKENLNIGEQIMGNQQQTNNNIIEKYCYEDDPTNCEIFGGLYQKLEALQYTEVPGNQGICPQGWHIPKGEEWVTLDEFINHDGNALKSIGVGSGAGAGTNTTGFSALLSGFRWDSGSGLFFSNLNISEGWYSSSSGGSIGLKFDNSLTNNLNIIITNSPTGHPVRCIKD